MLGVFRVCLGVSHPARGAWIEMGCKDRRVFRDWSHPARGAWIEISSSLLFFNDLYVAPRKGCVD